MSAENHPCLLINVTGRRAILNFDDVGKHTSTLVLQQAKELVPAEIARRLTPVWSSAILVSPGQHLSARPDLVETPIQHAPVLAAAIASNSLLSGAFGKP